MNKRIVVNARLRLPPLFRQTSTVVMSAGTEISSELSPGFAACLLCDLGKVTSPL